MSFEQRDLRGYAQFREMSQTTGKTIGGWKFQIIGFDYLGQHGLCRIATTDGKGAAVRIDDQDRLIIAGRRYGRKKWNH